MLDKDVTGNIEAAEKLAREKASLLLKEQDIKKLTKKESDKNPDIDELSSDGSGSAFAGTEEVKE